MKTAFVGVVVSGFMAASVSPPAMAQPEQAGATVIQQRGTQNSGQIGTGNQSTQMHGSGNESTTQSANPGVQDDRSLRAGASEGESASSGSSTAGDERPRDDKGLHKGWEKNKHRERMQ